VAILVGVGLLWLDSYLLAQESLVSIEGVHPALVQRRAVADHVARLLNQLGLHRVARKLGTLETYRARCGVSLAHGANPPGQSRRDGP